MKGLKVWVQGEECDDGVIVTDAATGNEVVIRGVEVKTKQVVSRFNRPIKIPMVEGRQVGIDGPFLIVRFGAAGPTVRVKREEPEPPLTDTAA